MNRLLKPLFLLIGCALFAWVLGNADLSAVGRLLGEAGWGFVLAVVVYGGVLWLDTLSWKYAFRAEESAELRTWELFRIRAIGESFNAITPLGTLGGEPVKAQLLKERQGLTFKQGLASQVVGRTTLLVGLILFLIPGSILLARTGGVPVAFQSVSQSGLILFSTLIFLFLLFQITGCLGRIASWISARLGQPEPSGLWHQMVVLDGLMSAYYRRHGGRFGLSVGWGFAGWWLGILEVGATLYVLGHWLGFSELWIVEALIQLVRVCSFYIPMSLGAQEGGLVLIFQALGLSADLGLAVSLVRRVRELIWIGIGLLLGWGAAFKAANSPLPASDELG